MKRMGCLLLLAALLTLWELHSVTGDTPVLEPDERPGVCPPERHVNPSHIPRSNGSYCQTNADCAAGKKCCVDNQSKMCKPPAEERPGKCPVCGNQTTARLEDFCTSDSECAPNHKCCFSNGGLTCVSLIVVKPGTCKDNPIRCFIPGRAACDNDGGCPRNEKCCSDGCGAQCLAPIKGFCPPNDLPPGRVTTCDVQCKNCSETQMCCPYGCRRICREMSKERLGFCPFDPKRCAPKPPHQCEGDIDCTSGQKCCLMDCKQQCVPALKARPGSCPVTDDTYCVKTTKPLDPECATDYHCTSPKKCCKAGCTEKCINP